MERLKLSELKAKSPAQLLEFAEQLEVEGASTMRKQELMFAILKQLAEQESLWLHWDRGHPQTHGWLREHSGLSDFSCDLLLEDLADGPLAGAPSDQHWQEISRGVGE